MFPTRTKHIETHYHFIWEKVLTQDTKLLRIRIEDEVAEIFTKGLGKTKFEVFWEALSVVDNKFAREIIIRMRLVYYVIKNTTIFWECINRTS